MPEDFIDSTGLDLETLNKLCQIIAMYPQITQVKLYGSRAKGTFKPYSDIDLAIYGENLDRFVIDGLVMEFEDSDIVYKVDVQVYANIKNTALREHIDRVNVPSYHLDILVVTPLLSSTTPKDIKLIRVLFFYQCSCYYE